MNKTESDRIYGLLNLINKLNVVSADLKIVTEK